MRHKCTRKSDLSLPQQRLVVEMQRTSYGRIEGLLLRDGEPVFTDSTRVIRTIKLGGGDNGPRAEHLLPETELKREHIELFRHLPQIGNGLVCALHIAAGLPRHIEVEQEAEPSPCQSAVCQSPAGNQLSDAKSPGMQSHAVARRAHVA